jgi:sialate O-acetylesterase
MICHRRCLSILALTLLAALLVLTADGYADVKLPALFSDHAVLQCDSAVPVWGWADAAEEVSVSIAGQNVSTQAGSDGKWMLKLAKLPAGGPHTLLVRGKNTLTIEHVLVGEVWLCSGQSNMAMTVNRAKDFEQESAAAKWPQIRMFKVGHKSAAAAEPNCAGEWQLCSPETVGEFTAAGYFFSREIHQRLHMPVGLINSSVGGTAIEAWISPAAQEKLRGMGPESSEPDKMFDAAKATETSERDVAARKGGVKKGKKAKATGKATPSDPKNPVDASRRKVNVGGLFNGMIAPLIPYGIRGALWYQGEANTFPLKAPLYRHQLPLLIEDWRSRWGEGAFPFAWVQLPNFAAPGRDWPTVREAMLKALSAPHTGMAVTIDIGESSNIHPANKQEAGRRLAVWALAKVYGQPLTPSGPLYAGCQYEGPTATISFQYAEGLMAKGGELMGFSVAGADHQWHTAKAEIHGQQVVVTSPEVKQPVAVRYAWANEPECNLYNAAGLPASPFRTED